MDRTAIESKLQRVRRRRVRVADMIGAGVVDGVPDAILEELRAERRSLDAEMIELIDAWAVLEDRLESLLPAGLVGRIY